MTVRVEHLGADRYRVRVYAGTDPLTGKGRQIGKTFRAASRRDAGKLAARHEADLRDRVGREAAVRGTVAELATAWIAHRAAQNDATTTMRRHRQITDRIVADLGKVPLDVLTARHIDAWYGKLRAERLRGRARSDSTLHHYHRVLRMILRQGVRWGMVEKVATENVTAPRLRQPTVHPPSVGELAVLLAAATPDLRFAATLAAQTGLRRGELLGLRWSDWHGPLLQVSRSVVEVDGQVEVKVPKSGHGRVIGLLPATIEALAAHREHLADASVGMGSRLAVDGAILADLGAAPDGTVARRPAWLTQAWRRLSVSHGVHVRFHDLRHFHATLLIAQGVPLPDVQKRLGHTRPTTTLDIYTHASEGGDQRMLDALAGVILPI